MGKVKITDQGIRRILRKYDFIHSIAEYIWNGFDANASNVDLYYEANGSGILSQLTIQDNGNGISKNLLDQKFTPFLESNKAIDPENARIKSAVHGKNGSGRLTFFTFASKAIWETVFEDNNERFKYTITIKQESLDDYLATEVEKTNDPLGTKVIFRGIHSLNIDFLLTDVKNQLIREFCWFLELNSKKGYSINLNDKPIEYTEIVQEKDVFTITIKPGGDFHIRFFQWKKRISGEYSHYYCIGSDNHERFKKTTSLNNKGDNFYHSVYIESSYFNNIPFWDFSENDSSGQLSLFEAIHGDTFRALHSEVDKYLREKRKPYVRTLANSLIEEYKKKDIFPLFGSNSWDKLREKQLQNFVKELYVVEPKIFSQLNEQQQKTFIRLLNLVMDSNEADALFDILTEVVDLGADGREQLASVLKYTKLSYITETISLINDRVKAISQLKKLIDPNFGANEPNHIQKFIEAHYWMFGEQYHLVTAAEPDFEQALRKFIQMTSIENTDGQVNPPDKNKEMDIFAVRRIVAYDVYQNIVVELKNPKVRLGEDQLGQIKRYSRVIKSISQFNASNMEWKFILVGN